MSTFEIITSVPEQNYAYKRLSVLLESELALHNGYGEEHMGISDNLPSILDYFCQWKCTY
jgi:hypothetical protein